MMKVNLFLRLFEAGQSLPCAAAHVEVDVTPNSISYASTDLMGFTYVADPSVPSPILWQKVGDAIFAACTCYDKQSVGRIFVGGDYEITWRKA